MLTDNNPLAHLQTANLGSVEQRWAAKLAGYNFDIKFQPVMLMPRMQMQMSCHEYPWNPRGHRVEKKNFLFLPPVVV